MLLKIIDHDSIQYNEMIDLRLKVLLQPIGISEDYINKANEKDDILISAYDNDQLVGCCVLTRIDEDIIQLRQMAVHAAFQGKQYGRSILSFAEKTASEKGYKIIMMHARNPVIDFYKKCGYNKTGSEFFEVGIG
ncbi:MAG TPA: GNAT family N-acetyltransferase, partial [Flavisolibacter sp.]|nr:GNAT family N-acetyltransferase [Flavisolibacter sp.]